MANILVRGVPETGRYLRGILTRCGFALVAVIGFILIPMIGVPLLIMALVGSVLVAVPTYFLRDKVRHWRERQTYKRNS